MHRVVISEFMDQPAIDALASRHDVIYDATLVDNPETLFTTLEGAKALIVRNRTQVNRALLAKAPALKVVGRLGVGLDNIDLAACEERKIAVIPATGANARAVAEYVLASALLLLRGAYHRSRDVALGGWPRIDLSNGLELENRVLGLIGFGGIGRLVATLFAPLGAKLLAFDPALAPNDAVFAQHHAICAPTVEDLLEASDIVSLHIPLTKETRHLINEKRLALLKPSAILINTSRGGIIDEQALLSALAGKRLRGAALDVFDEEPLPNDPRYDVPNLLLTPHIAGLTREANQRVSELIAERINTFLKDLA